MSFLAFHNNQTAVCQTSRNPLITFLFPLSPHQQSQWTNKFGGIINEQFIHTINLNQTNLATSQCKNKWRVDSSSVLHKTQNLKIYIFFLSLQGTKAQLYQSIKGGGDKLLRIYKTPLMHSSNVVRFREGLEKLI